MGAVAASTSKSICGWTWHPALNIIPPWSTPFLHVDLVTAVTDWEGRVYPTAVGIALLTRDSQPRTAGASRNVRKQFITKKKRAWKGCLWPWCWLIAVSAVQMAGWIFKFSSFGDFWDFFFCQLDERVGVRGWYSRVGCREGTLGKGCGQGSVLGCRAVPWGSWAAGCRLEAHNIYYSPILVTKAELIPACDSVLALPKCLLGIMSGELRSGALWK